MIGLLPREYMSSTNTKKPKWRDWAEGYREGVPNNEYVFQVEKITARIMSDVGNDGKRWKNLIELMPSLPNPQFELLCTKLGGIDLNNFSSSEKAMIWNELREIISRQRSYPDADWSLSIEHIDILEGIYNRFEPDDLLTFMIGCFRICRHYRRGKRMIGKSAKNYYYSVRLRRSKEFMENWGWKEFWNSPKSLNNLGY